MTQIKEQILSKTLYRLGVPRHIRGYQYLKEAVRRCKKNPDLLFEITTKLYPQIAKMFETTEKAVERDIRYAICYCWKNNQEDIKAYFGGIGDKRPTNSNFIATLCDKI